MSKRISINPDFCNGRPVVRGTRITVQTVLEFLATGDSVEEVLEEYPKLTRAGVRACLDYASRVMGNRFSARFRAGGMKGFLFDENLPTRLRFSPRLPIVPTFNNGRNPSDSQIWEFARKHDLAIVSKDADFSDRMMTKSPPPRVVHLRFGNLGRGVSSLAPETGLRAMRRFSTGAGVGKGRHLH